MFSDLKYQVNIKENNLLKIDRELLAILLNDKTTDRNLIWATDNYKKHGSKYNSDKPISVDLITSRNGSIIKPRTQKSKAEQQMRSRQKAEVFTPCWVVNTQNNLIDESWFGRKDIFNTEEKMGWKANTELVSFPDDKSWTDYVSAKRMEVSCGEAPYITSRYDATNGEYIEVPNRIGLLDRKIRIVNENTNTKDEWIKWAYIAVQNIYGFDWQGDNVLIARENVLFTVVEHYIYKFNEELTTQDLIGFAKVIAWNIWQMDGLKYVIPNSCCSETVVEETLFEKIVHSTECEGCKKNNNRKHNGIYCYIKDWETHRKVKFIDVVEGK